MNPLEQSLKDNKESSHTKPSSRKVEVASGHCPWGEGGGFGQRGLEELGKFGRTGSCLREMGKWEESLNGHLFLEERR